MSSPRMTKFVALLRAVNLGGPTQVSMAELRQMSEKMGFSDIQTLLQSGNLVFTAGRESPASLEDRLESESNKMFGRPLEVFVRSEPEWRGVVEANPFPEEAVRDPGHLLVTVLKAAPSPAAWSALEAAIQGRERIRGVGRHAYIVYPDGVGRSRLTAVVIEKHLGTRGTSRNWNTVSKIHQLLGG